MGSCAIQEYRFDIQVQYCRLHGFHSHTREKTLLQLYENKCLDRGTRTYEELKVIVQSQITNDRLERNNAKANYVLPDCLQGRLVQNPAYSAYSARDQPKGKGKEKGKGNGSVKGTLKGKGKGTYTKGKGNKW